MAEAAHDVARVVLHHGDYVVSGVPCAMGECIFEGDVLRAKVSRRKRNAVRISLTAVAHSSLSTKSSRSIFEMGVFH